ncbi:hypothetical protein TomTYG45_00470 [Sphingobium sp. TomTYG45]
MKVPAAIIRVAKAAGPRHVGHAVRFARFVHQFFKKRAIMDHRLTQILGIGLSACVTYGDVMAER